MLFQKKQKGIDSYTKQDLAEAVLSDGKIVIPVYSDNQVREFIVQPRGSIFRGGIFRGSRKPAKPIKF